MNVTSEQFNEIYPIGTKVVYQPLIGGEGIDSKKRSEAWNLGHGTAVVMVFGKSRGIAGTHSGNLP